MTEKQIQRAKDAERERNLDALAKQLAATIAQPGKPTTGTLMPRQKMLSRILGWDGY